MTDGTDNLGPEDKDVEELLRQAAPGVPPAVPSSPPDVVRRGVETDPGQSRAADWLRGVSHL